MLTLGLLSATISSVDNYLLAAMQTLAVDVFKRQKIAEMFRKPPEIRKQEEREILLWCKRYMPLLAGLMVVVFSILFYVIHERVFAYQFVMYGAAVTLFPIVVGAFRRLEIASAKPRRAIPSGWAFFSVLGGLIVVFGSFFGSGLVRFWIQSLTSFDVSTDAIANLTPLTGLLTAASIYGIGLIHRKFERAQ